jgi:predicted amidophosphoribosyltransferase
VVDTPLVDDETTTLPGRGLCPVCWATFQPTGRQRFCSDNCRKTAWSRTHRSVPHPVEPIPPPGRRRDATVYSCPGCDTRYYGQQWCPDCHQPCTRVGFGGLCPHCDEPVALTDLVDTAPARTTPIQLSRG